MVGNFADIENYGQKSQINQVTKWYKPWFYKHVETFLTLGETEEFIPLREYLLRHSDPKINNFIWKFSHFKVPISTNLRLISITKPNQKVTIH